MYRSIGYAVVLALLASCTGCNRKPAWGVRHPDPNNNVTDTRAQYQPSFQQTIADVVNMPQNGALQEAAGEHGLGIVNVMWEDTGRYQGSSVGPNISDLTLQVRDPASGQTHLLPVIRYPNFSDRTADIRADKLWVRVGNHREGGELYSVPLTEVLANLRSYINNPEALYGSGNLLAERDTHFLVSAQHVFVPIQSEGTAEFNPVLYNYQSSPGNPAVLTLLVTRQGMSAAVIENRPGDQSLQGWGQQLFFNRAGNRTMFTAERRSAVQERIERGEATSQDEGALEEGADMMMLVQIPLRQREMPRRQPYATGGAIGNSAPMDDGYAAESAAVPSPAAPAARSDVENAVIGHGEDQGMFATMQHLQLERDPRFPVRVTIQLYRATSNGVVDADDLELVHDQIERIYDDGDYVGSLVVPESQRTRPTEWTQIRHRCGMPYRHTQQHWGVNNDTVPCDVPPLYRCPVVEPMPQIVDQYVQ